MVTVTCRDLAPWCGVMEVWEFFQVYFVNMQFSFLQSEHYLQHQMKKHFVVIEKFIQVRSHKMIYFYLVVFLHRFKTKMIEMVVWDLSWFYYAMDINWILFFKMSWKSVNMKNVQEISLHLAMTHHLFALKMHFR